MQKMKRRFLAVENKTFDVVYEGRNVEGLRLSENGWGFLVSISYGEEDVKWLVETLKGFYGMKGEQY